MRSSKPLINIITRTSNREEYFKRCKASIDNQTYDNINHIVGTDNSDSYAPNAIQLSKKQRTGQQKQMYIDGLLLPNTFYHAPYNLYLNELNDYVEEGYTMYLDDDDYLVSKDAIERIVEQVVIHDIDILFFQNIIGTKTLPTLPTLESIVEYNQAPKIGAIGGSCMLMNREALEYAIWDEWSCSDNRVIRKLLNNNGFSLGYLDKVIAATQSGAHNGNPI